jgi:hypothetical protein
MGFHTSSQAYIRLTDDRSDDVVAKLIRAGELGTQRGVDAHHSIVVDLGHDGHLIAIEPTRAAASVPPIDLSAERRFLATRVRRGT